jgi:hypothetical protein
MHNQNPHLGFRVDYDTDIYSFFINQHRPILLGERSSARGCVIWHTIGSLSYTSRDLNLAAFFSSFAYMMIPITKGEWAYSRITNILA